MPTPYEVCLEMLCQRNYTLHEQHPEFFISAVKPDGSLVCVLLMEVMKFDVNKLKEYLQLLKEINISHSIIVYKDKITSKTKKIIENLNDIVIEVFCENEISYNITKNDFVPLHERLSPDESKKFKSEFGIKIPTILSFDPISRFYGFNKGDIVKITEKDGYVFHAIVK